MPHHKFDGDDLDDDDLDGMGPDTYGMLLLMFNAIQALAVAHPNRAVVRDVLEQAADLQLEMFESGGADLKLIKAYEHYSNALLSLISNTKVPPMNIDLDLTIG